MNEMLLMLLLEELIKRRNGGDENVETGGGADGLSYTGGRLLPSVPFINLGTRQFTPAPLAQGPLTNFGPQQSASFGRQSTGALSASYSPLIAGQTLGAF